MSKSDEEPNVPRVASNAAWAVIVVLALGVIGFGLWSYLRQEHEGDISTGLRTPGYGGAAWGLYIAFYVYAVGVSFAGIVVAAITRLFEVKVLKCVTRIAEFLTISALLAGAAGVIADLGRPFDGLTKLPRFATPSSPFFGTFTLVVAGYLFSSSVYFFLAGRADAAQMAKSTTSAPLRMFYRVWASGYKDTREEQLRHRRVSFWLSIGILPLLVTAHSTLGFIFGIQSGRPGWFSALQAPAFVVLAGVSGTGMLILFAIGARWLFKLSVSNDALRWLGNLLWILACVYIYFVIVEELTASYAAPAADKAMAHEIVGGKFAKQFWLVAVCLFFTAAIPFTLWISRKTSPAWLAVAAIVGNVAAVFKRLIIVVPSQTHGALVPMEKGGFYKPALIEWGVVAGLLAVIVLLFAIFGRIFPLVPSEHGEASDEKAPREWGRTVATALTMVASGFLVIIGLLDSARVFSHGEVDPRVHGSPIVFATGVMVLFISAIVYEVVPRRKRRAQTGVGG